MQLISFCQRIFPAEHAWLASYHIQATGPDTGLIETITSAQDLGRLGLQSFLTPTLTPTPTPTLIPTLTLT